MAETQSAQKQDHPERFDPATMRGGLMEAEHRARYWWAAGFVEGKEVLDAGCGTGYGLAIVAAADPARLVGLDISEEALELVREQLPDAPKTIQGDVRALPFPDASFDVVTCFEVIEHIDGPEDAFDELRRVLRPDGLLLISSPNRDVYPPGNPHHVHEFAPDELRAALRSRFGQVTMFPQHPWLATAIPGAAAAGASPAGGWRVASIEEGPDAGGETFTLAVASDAQVNVPEGMVVLASDFDIRWWHDQVEHLRVSNADGLRQLEAATVEADRARSELQQASRRVLELEQEVAALPELRHHLSQLETAELEIHRQIVKDMKASLSWRITAPLRAAKRMLRG